MAKRNKEEENVNIYEVYMKDISRYGTIDGVKAHEYLKKYKNGTPSEKKIAKERLVGGLQRFVLSIANKYATAENLMDVISEGNVGLMRAIEEYDMDSEVKFTTYATPWIRKYIMRYITVDEPIVAPNNAIKLVTYVPKIRQEFWNKNLRQPTNEEVQEILSEKYHLNFANKDDLSEFQSVSIDEKYDEYEDGQEFMECSAYTSRTATCNTDSFAKKDDAKAIVSRVLSTLNDRDAYIVKCIYGIDCQSKSMDDVAAEVGISHERVRQIAVNSVKKLSESCVNLKNAF